MRAPASPASKSSGIPPVAHSKPVGECAIDLPRPHGSRTPITAYLGDAKLRRPNTCGRAGDGERAELDATASPTSTSPASPVGTPGRRSNFDLEEHPRLPVRPGVTRLRPRESRVRTRHRLTEDPATQEGASSSPGCEGQPRSTSRRGHGRSRRWRCQGDLHANPNNLAGDPMTRRAAMRRHHFVILAGPCTSLTSSPSRKAAGMNGATYRRRTPAAIWRRGTALPASTRCLPGPGLRGDASVRRSTVNVFGRRPA